MKKILLSTIACASMMLAANSDYKYEITPMFSTAFAEHNTELPKAYGNGGLALGFNLNDSMFDQIELGFLRSIEDVDYKTGTPVRNTGITRVFTNLVKEYELNSAMSLYALAGVGAEFFDDEYENNESGVFGNYGAGLKMNVYNDIAMKIDLRHVVEADHGDNTLLYNIGLGIPFGAVAKPAPVVEKPAPVVVKAPVKAPVAAPKDSDGDGVIDGLDKCPDTMRGAKVDTVGCMTLINLNINFDTDKSNIKDSYNSRIAEFAKIMNSNPKLKATIEAHTDSVGSDKYNQKLSERRAASAVDALKALKVDSSRIKAVGYGESKPEASNDTTEGRAQNRRVEAVMSK